MTVREYAVDLSRILARLDAMQEKESRPIIAIDGRGGAGKSSLARAIAAVVPHAAHVEYDWFHLPQSEMSLEHRFDYRRLTAELLAPFRSGERDFQFKRYNWGYLSGSPDGYADEPITLRGVDVLILEGCRVLTPPILDFFDLKIWVDTAPEEALTRGMRRDIDEYGLDPVKVQVAWEEWTMWEAQELAREDRRARADIIL